MVRINDDFVVEVELVQNVNGMELSLMGEAYVDENGESVLLQLDECCNSSTIIAEAKDAIREEMYARFERGDTSPIYEIDL